jgi:hypothetical protein
MNRREFYIHLWFTPNQFEISIYGILSTRQCEAGGNGLSQLKSMYRRCQVNLISDFFYYQDLKEGV